MSPAAERRWRVDAVVAGGVAVGCGHGTRAQYRSGCRCVVCRAANAQRAARDRWRRRKGFGTPRDWVREARRRVRQLEVEGYTRARIARLAGWKDGRGYHVTFRTGQAIRWRTLLRIRRAAQWAMLEGAEA